MLLIRIAPGDTGLFRYLLEGGGGHLCMLTVLDPAKALFKLLFSPHQREEVAALLDLPPYTLPLSMLVLGTPAKERPATPHPTANIVMEERYRRADARLRAAQIAEMDAMFRPHAAEPGARVRDIYQRKHTSDFMTEMDRSLALWYQNWTGEAPLL